MKSNHATKTGFRITGTKPSYVLESQSLCEQYGIDPSQLPIFEQLSDAELRDKLRDYGEFLAITDHFMERMLGTIAEPIPVLLAVCDYEASILQIRGDESIKSFMDQIGFKEGVRFTEELTGTNVVNLSLRLKRPIQLVGDDHYHRVFYQAACYSVPFRFEQLGDLTGTICLMTTAGLHNPLFMNMLQSTLDLIEREIMLRNQNKQLHILNQIMMETEINAVIVTDRKGQITEINKCATNIIGVPREKMLGQLAQSLPYVGSYFTQVLEKGSRFEDIELRIELRNLVGLFDVFPIRDEKGSLIGAYGHFRDITERYETEMKINYMAYHDELTTLPNRRMLIKYLEDKICDYERSDGNKLAVMFLDLDRFKMVNDTLGHSEGDVLLQQVASRLVRCIGSGDLVARMGGDEFMIVLERPHVKEIEETAREVLKTFGTSFVIGEYDFHVSASLGIAVCPDNGTDVNSLMIFADTAMYRAKAKGKNTYQFFDPDMPLITHEQLVLEMDLRKAIERGELLLHYQPQVIASTGQLVGLEALVRWQHPVLGIISPDKFVPVAEETGLILPLSLWVLNEACRQNKRWQDEGFRPIRVSVNLSALQFSDEAFVQTVASVLEETGLDPQYLELELTETMAMDVDHAVGTLNALKELGVQLAMDDFGTGYSSLNHLKRFGLHRLKIDQSFVRDLISDSNDADIVGTIIAMGHLLGLRVIAEGVETSEQFDFLLSKKCDEVQGYYISKPLPPDQVVKLLEKN